MLRLMAFAASALGLVLLVAGSEAFAGAFQEGRRVSVGRAVSHGGYAHAKFRQEVRGMSDEELHGVIAESRKQMLHHRLEKFRKKKPSAGSKYEWQYKIALAKTFLKERELAAMTNEDEVPLEPLSKDYPARPTLAEEMKQTEDLDRARTEWYDLGGWASVPRGQKSDYPRNVGFEKQYYRKYGKVYDPKNVTQEAWNSKGWSWTPSPSDGTNLPPWGMMSDNVTWKQNFEPENVELRKKRLVAKAEERAEERARKVAREAFQTKVEGSSGSVFVGAAFLGLLAAKGRRP